MNNLCSKIRCTCRVKILPLLFISSVFIGACRQEDSTETTQLNCLPKSILLKDGSKNLIRTTIADKLRELKASCQNQDLLVDSKGKEIRFSAPIQSCGGAGFNQEMLDIRRKELEALQQKYTVIVVPCSPESFLYP